MNMSYCMWENTATALTQLNNDVQDFFDSSLDLDIESYKDERDMLLDERQALDEVAALCEALLEKINEMREHAENERQ
jgi:hypothetical protein